MKTKQNTTQWTEKVMKSGKHASLLGAKQKLGKICAYNKLKYILKSRKNNQNKSKSLQCLFMYNSDLWTLTKNHEHTSQIKTYMKKKKKKHGVKNKTKTGYLLRLLAETSTRQALWESQLSQRKTETNWALPSNIRDNTSRHWSKQYQ